MNKVLEYFKNLDYKPFKKDITVFGWKGNYDYTLCSNALPYLFEKLPIVENIAPKTNENRDGRLKENKYICVHDTGDTVPTHDAKFWSETVYHEKWMDSEAPYAASFQYVVGNDGIYHNIPDNEIGYHAGDSTKFSYTLHPTGVKGSGKYTLDIKDGFYYINNEKTLVPAPIKKDGTYPQITEICDQGILVKNIDNEYYIGETYFNETYKLIANRAGNNNSIGIEVCMCEGQNIFLNYARCAKLVALKLNENNLTLDDIKQHHYFSGKNCPQTLRTAKLWPMFIDLVKVEKDVLEFVNEGYKLSLTNLNNISKEGIIININKPYSFTLNTIFNGVTDSLNFNGKLI